ncbi:uncharacterized protein LOC126894074 [Daktulosphaira vitifoliae]|uniref:uncharacterized protein LOC126894074 n=1 Tax=Daktulosphaira vitifoliae TaxID=58002 RepID=UPI0021AAE84F|nr:uncharacterized protein LOC126894074 [Daktulosphaira vitifoliae]
MKSKNLTIFVLLAVTFQFARCGLLDKRSRYSEYFDKLKELIGQSGNSNPESGSTPPASTYGPSTYGPSTEQYVAASSNNVESSVSAKDSSSSSSQGYIPNIGGSYKPPTEFAGYEIPQIPSGYNPQMPSGMPQMPTGYKPPQIPSGYKPPQIPGGYKIPGISK